MLLRRKIFYPTVSCSRVNNERTLSEMYSNNQYKMMLPIRDTVARSHSFSNCRSTSMALVGSFRPDEAELRRKRVAVRRKYYVYWKDRAKSVLSKLPDLSESKTAMFV